MKKTILPIIILIILGIIPINSFAISTQKNEFRILYEKAENMRGGLLGILSNVDSKPNYRISWGYSDDGSERESNTGYFTFDLKDTAINNQKDENYTVWSIPYERLISYTDGNKTYDINSIDDLKNVAELYYSKNASQDFLDFVYYYSKGINYLTAESGTLYFANPGITSHYGNGIHDITDIQVTGDFATANFIYYISWPASPLLYYNIPVKFAKEDGVWKIDELFFDKVSPENIEKYRIDNPSTGSSAPLYITLAGAAILCALPVVKRKRRRI